MYDRDRLNNHVMMRNLKKIKAGNFGGMSLVDVRIELKEELLQAEQTLEMYEEEERKGKTETKEKPAEAKMVKGKGRERLNSTGSNNYLDLIRKELPKDDR